MADMLKMSRKELERLISSAQKALKSLEARERRAARKAAQEAAAKFGFSLEELASDANTTSKKAKASKPKKATAAKKKRAAKYANPADPKQTWSGLGRKPRWFTDAVAAGTDPKSLEI